MTSANENTLYQMRQVFNEALALAEKKNTDYGDAWRDQGWRGNLSRILEKTKRLRTLLWKDGSVIPEVASEGSRETALDIINTACFFILNHDARVEWGHETPFGLAPAPSGVPTSGNGLTNYDNGNIVVPAEIAAEVTGSMAPVPVPGSENGEGSGPRPRPHPQRQGANKRQPRETQTS